MILKYLPRVALLAAAVVAMSGMSAKAAPLTYTAGDLFLAFRADAGAGSTQTILINIGQASTYRDATSSFTLDIGNIGADLTAIYGDGWSTRSDMYWGVVGTTYLSSVNGDPLRTIYAGRAEGSDAWLGASGSALGSAATKINTMGTTYASGTSTSNSSVALNQANTSTNSYYSYISSTDALDFGYFLGGVETSSANGLQSAGLDLYRVTTNSTGSLEGTFSINSAGVVTFTAVPEPTTVAMLAAGALLVVFVVRNRRKAVQA